MVCMMHFLDDAPHDFVHNLPSASWRSSQGSSTTALSTAASHPVRPFDPCVCEHLAVWSPFRRGELCLHGRHAPRAGGASRGVRTEHPERVSQTRFVDRARASCKRDACISAGWCGTTTGAWISMLWRTVASLTGALSAARHHTGSMGVRWAAFTRGGSDWRAVEEITARRCARSTPTTARCDFALFGARDRRRFLRNEICFVSNLIYDRTRTSAR